MTMGTENKLNWQTIKRQTKVKNTQRIEKLAKMMKRGGKINDWLAVSYCKLHLEKLIIVAQNKFDAPISYLQKYKSLCK